MDNIERRRISDEELVRNVDVSIVAALEQDVDFRTNTYETVQLLGVEAAHDLIEGNARYDSDARVRQPDGSFAVVSHYPLRLLMAAMPSYLESAGQAGLDPAKSFGLVLTIMTAEGRSRRSHIHDPVVRLTRAFAHHTNRPLHEDEYAELHSLINETADSSDNNRSVIDAYDALSRLGFTTTESVRLIRDDLWAQSPAIYAAMPLLSTLSVAPVKAEVLAEACRHSTSDDFTDMQANYAMLSEFVYHACAYDDVPANDLLTMLNGRLRQGVPLRAAIDEYLQDTEQNSEYRPVEGTVTVDPQQRIVQHFPLKPGGLELAALPYRKERSLAAGVRDLGGLALRAGANGEVVGEGLWVFDPQSDVSVWYSLGGKTEIDVFRNAVHHSAPPYPIRQLSDAPMLFHCHPVGYEPIIGVTYDNPAYPNEAVPLINRFFAATPSSGDFKMVADIMREPAMPDAPLRSLIVHGSGITEYAFLNDVAAVEELSHEYRSLRDEVLLGMSKRQWSRLLTHRKSLFGKVAKETDAVVGELVGRLNDQLPGGFVVRLMIGYDGSDLY